MLSCEFPRQRMVKVCPARPRPQPWQEASTGTERWRSAWRDGAAGVYQER
ncbi:hypothetical protein [Actinoplanes sp. G11-F43]